MRLEYQNIGIEQAHDLREYLQLRPVGEMVEIFFDEITEEAQNALLKILEDLPEGTQVRLFCSRPALLLPTLLSRGVVEITAQSIIPNPAVQPPEKSFLADSMDARLTLISSMFPKDPTPEEKAQSRLDAKHFLEALTHSIYQAEGQSEQYDRYKRLAELDTARKHLDLKELPARTVLEHLALVL